MRKRMKQGYDARLDESLGFRHHGGSKQSMKARRDESKGMEKHYGKRPYSGDKMMDMSDKMGRRRKGCC